MLLFGLGLVDFLLAAVAFLLFIPAVYLVEYKRFGWSGTCMLASFALLGAFFWSDITRIFAEHGTAFGIVILVIGYITAGVATAFIYWIFYCWRAREKFQAAYDELNLNNIELPPVTGLDLTYVNEFKAAKRTYLVLSSNYTQIFEDYESDLKLHIQNIPDRAPPNESDNDRIIRLTAEYRTEVERFLPPRFATCKKFIVWAALDWPITLIWLLTSRIVKQLIERLLSWQRRIFDWIGRVSFGKI